MRQAPQLAWTILERETSEEGVGPGAARSVTQVVGDRVDADEQDVRVQLRGPVNEGPVTRSEVDVHCPEALSSLGQSSTVHPALFLAFDEVHASRIARPEPIRLECAVPFQRPHHG